MDLTIALRGPQARELNNTVARRAERPDEDKRILFSLRPGHVGPRHFDVFKTGRTAEANDFHRMGRLYEHRRPAA
jgi:hypothetical protein